MSAILEAASKGIIQSKIQVIRVLWSDWQQQWGNRPVLLETFVDPQYYDGTCYRAANFKYLGMTGGTGLVRKGKTYTMDPKKIFVIRLRRIFGRFYVNSMRLGGLTDEHTQPQSKS
jgi:hypothetical protein